MSNKMIFNSAGSTVANNKKAYHDYFIENTMEVGIVLAGTEVKSVRCGKASIIESHVYEQDEELFITGLFIPEYEKANNFNHNPRRDRKLLIHKREIKRLIGLIRRKGYTLVPTKLYFNKRNIAKLEVGIAKGKKQHDKRQAIKERDIMRDARRNASD